MSRRLVSFSKYVLAFTMVCSVTQSSFAAQERTASLNRQETIAAIEKNIGDLQVQLATAKEDLAQAQTYEDGRMVVKVKTISTLVAAGSLMATIAFAVLNAGQGAEGPLALATGATVLSAVTAIGSQGYAIFTRPEYDKAVNQVAKLEAKLQELRYQVAKLKIKG